MPTKQKKVRVAIGTRTSARSSVWTFIVHRNEIYISSRMFSSYHKVSFHSSGDCQWSRTDKWVTEDKTRKNVQRHIQKWKIEYPNSLQSLHVFRLQIPKTDLRIHENDLAKKKTVWISNIPDEATVSIECYITAPCENALKENAALPPEHKFAFALQLENNRWFVGIIQLIHLNDIHLDNLRAEIKKFVKNQGAESTTDMRAVGFINNPEETFRGFIEVCLD